MAMELADVSQLSILHGNVFTNGGKETIFLEWSCHYHQFTNLDPCKVAQLQLFANFFCKVVFLS